MRIHIFLFLVPSLAFCQPYSQGRLDEDVITTPYRNVNKIYYNAYFPADYDLSPDRKYPIVYFLSSAINHNDWITHGEINKLFDKLIGERKIPPFIGIMLCGSIYKSPNDWKDLFENSIIKNIEGRVRVLPESRSKRAIVGFSMGGYYALKSANELENRFLCSISFCPLYVRAHSKAKQFIQLYHEEPYADLVTDMIFGIKALNKISTKNFQLIISSDKNVANDDFQDLKKILVENPNSQSWIKNGEHDWDFVLKNTEPALCYLGDIFFGYLDKQE